MTQTVDTRTRIIAAMAQILEVEPATIQGEQRLREDLGMDSLGSLELLATISQELEISLEMEDVLTLATVDEACAFVTRHYVQQHGFAHDAR